MCQKIYFIRNEIGYFSIPDENGYLEKDNFKLFEKELFKDNISREMFVMKWKCFKELMEELYVFIEFIVKNNKRIFATTHVLEYILCFLIWKLSKKYTVKSNVDYIKPTFDIATYRNGII